MLRTAPGERVMLPEFGCGLRLMVIGPNSEAAKFLIKVTVSDAMNATARLTCLVEPDIRMLLRLLRKDPEPESMAERLRKIFRPWVP